MTTSTPRRRGAATPAPATAAASASAPRFHVFVLDSGWQSAAGEALRDNLPTISLFADSCPIYVLTREQSHALLARDPDLIGKGPSLIVHDLHAKGGRGESGYHGFRLNLGVIHSREDAIQALQRFLHFTFTHRDCGDIETAVRERLHRDGLANTVEILHRSF
jgi:hypothetical protein